MYTEGMAGDSILTDDLRKLLIENGASLVGVADMHNIEGCDYSYGISIIVPMPVNVIRQIEKGPTKEFAVLYREFNNKLDSIALAGKSFLESKGYEVFAQIHANEKFDEEWRTRLPQKTVATRSGLGWIGKSCLLVTPEFGSAVSMVSILTNAPIVCDKPINESRCGSCHVCKNICPSGAIKGILWEKGIEREELFDKGLCGSYCSKLTFGLCGKCFLNCPYTKKYVRRIENGQTDLSKC